MQEASLPEYKKIAKRIIKQVHNGKYPPGSFLPSENQLSKEYGVTRPTIRKALEILKNQETIESYQGKGYQVKSLFWEQSLLKFYSFGRDIAARVSNAQTRLISLQRRSGLDYISDYQDLELWEITRLRLVDDLPLILETSYIPVKYLSLQVFEVESESLYSLIEKKGIHIVRAREYLDAVLPSINNQQLLMVNKNNPLFKTVRFSYSNQDELIEVRESLIRSDHFRFSVEMEL